MFVEFMAMGSVGSLACFHTGLVCWGLTTNEEVREDDVEGTLAERLTAFAAQLKNHYMHDMNRRAPMPFSEGNGWKNAASILCTPQLSRCAGCPVETRAHPSVQIGRAHV